MIQINIFGQKHHNCFYNFTLCFLVVSGGHTVLDSFSCDMVRYITTPVEGKHSYVCRQKTNGVYPEDSILAYIPKTILAYIPKTLFWRISRRLYSKAKQSTTNLNFQVLNRTLQTRRPSTQSEDCSNSTHPGHDQMVPRHILQFLQICTPH